MSVWEAEYEPSPWEPIAEEVALYERTGGSEPSALVGDRWIVLWTLGAKSGKVAFFFQCLTVASFFVCEP